MASTESELYWDATYAIAMSLSHEHPRRDPREVGLDELAQMVEALPGFDDDPALATEQILIDILNVWYEEAFHT